MAAISGNGAVARELSRLATLMEIAGENPFRIRAIKRGADAVRDLDVPIAPIAGDPAQLTAIPGIGAGLAGLIGEIALTGSTRAFADLSDRAPEGLIDVVDLPGVGAKTAAKLFSLAGVVDIESLRSTIVSGTIARTPGLGPKLAERLASGLEAFARKTGRARLGDSLPVARSIMRALRESLGPAYRIEITGSVRRWEETTGDINLLTTAPLAALVDFAANAGLMEPALANAALVAGHQSGIEVVIIQAPEPEFGSAWVQTTGPAGHLALLGDLPSRPFATEEGLYAVLGLPWIAPELRQGLDELERARRGALDDLITLDAIRGEVHCHTVWSDGHGTIEEMAVAARERGYHYLAISDHSHSLGVANGLSRERLEAQAIEIAEVSARLGFPLLRSSEVEVLRDGTLDFDDETLHGLDVVIAATHSSLNQPRADLMARVDAALSGRRVDLLAHPSGRLIERREPGDFDWPALYALAASRGVALEVNADPVRLDLNGERAREALEAGCLFSINCDAHSPRGFDYLEYGVATARRGFVPRDRVINSWPLDRLLDWLRSSATRGSA